MIPKLLCLIFAPFLLAVSARAEFTAKPIAPDQEQALNCLQVHAWSWKIQPRPNHERLATVSVFRHQRDKNGTFSNQTIVGFSGRISESSPDILVTLSAVGHAAAIKVGKSDVSTFALPVDPGVFPASPVKLDQTWLIFAKGNRVDEAKIDLSSLAEYIDVKIEVDK